MMRMITVFEAVICGVTRRTSAAGMKVTVTVLFDTVCTGICEPWVISASMLFCVDTRGLETMRTLPVDSRARSATSRFSAPLIEPSARPRAEGAAGLTRAGAAAPATRGVREGQAGAGAHRRIDAAVEAPLDAELLARSCG